MNKALKIAMLHDLLDSRGGAERTLLSTARHLGERGHDVSIYTLIFDRERTFTDLVENIDVHEVGALRGWLSRPVGTPSLTRRHLRRIFGRPDPAQQVFLFYGLQTFSELGLHDFDIIHASNYPASNAAALIKKRRDAVSIWGCNEPYRDLWLPAGNTESCLSRVVDKTVGSALRCLDLSLVSRLDGIYVNSNYTRSLIKQIYNRRATVIYPGVDTPPRSSEPDGSDLKKCYCPNGEKLILTVSRLYPAKRIGVLIKAVRQLRDRGKRVKLLIIGEGPERDRLYWLTQELGLRREIIFGGSVRDEEMPKYFAAADVFAFSAVDEPWGLVVLEAMAYGLPVVVPCTGGTAEMVQDHLTGFHVAGSDPNQYAEILETILEDEKLARRIGRAARSSVQEKYGIGQMVDSLEAFYQEMLESPLE